MIAEAASSSRLVLVHRSFRLASSAVLAAVALAACAGEPPAPLAPRSAAPEGRDGPVCAACTAEPTRYLRQLSLDLRGRPPSTEELERVAHDGVVSDETIEGMLRAPEFLTQVRTWHKALLWPNLDGFHIRGAPLVASDYDEANGKRKGGLFSPDPALVDGGAPTRVTATKTPQPHGFVFYGDNNVERGLRGGEATVGCDPKIEYPNPQKPSAAQPTYAVVGTDKKKRTYPYYDADGVPLPYHDAAHCPNFCSKVADADRAAKDYKPKREDYAPMSAKGPDALPHELDPPDAHCPPELPYRVVNSCDNRFTGGDPESVMRIRKEGVRKLRHYWSRATEVKTCAYEAQERTQSVTTGTPCAGSTLRDPSCGCGPSGVYCMPALGNNSPVASKAEHLVRSALNQEPLEIVASVVGRDEDYFDIFRTRRSFVTGPLVFLFENQLPALQGLAITTPAPADAFPNLPYDDFAFHEYVRDTEHAGVLTTPAYLGRFPSWRARVSQFRTAFMCRPFTPGSASLPSSDDPCTREPNLARRCGCKNCHVAIEPMTAWFGRWAERSARYLAPAEYPAHDPYCEQCARTKQGCTDRCRTQYVVDTVDAESARYAGTLRGYLYRTKEEEARIDEGPAGLVASAIASGELESCTVRTAWARLLGRPMSDDEVGAALPELLVGFGQSHHNYRALVKAIVTSPAYRRID
jgi:hypothetical protein